MCGGEWWCFFVMLRLLYAPLAPTLRFTNGGRVNPLEPLLVALGLFLRRHHERAEVLQKRLRLRNEVRNAFVLRLLH